MAIISCTSVGQIYKTKQDLNCLQSERNTAKPKKSIGEKLHRNSFKQLYSLFLMLNNNEKYIYL